MLVYGDQRERLCSRDCFAELQRTRANMARLPTGVDRHAALAGLFIDYAGLIQGLADARFKAEGQDDAWPEIEVMLAALIRCGADLMASWEGRDGEGALALLVMPDDLAEEIEIKLPEGHAYYALYPEGYALAARALRLRGPPVVIGLRSIGVGLAAIVAASLGLKEAFTLRPTGDPFAREVRVAPALAERLLANRCAHFIIVDEGPGLSGSSFGAAADWLETHGVSREHISFLPGHTGPLGPEAAEAHRQRWATAQRPVIDSDTLLADRLATWVAQLVGPLDGPVQDISGGAWRRLGISCEDQWPAVQPSFERRKFIARRGSNLFLVKFAGLGRIGAEKLALAQALQPFVPRPVGLLHGWLVEPWHAEAGRGGPTRSELSAYLRRRSTLGTSAGASLTLLQTMIERNLPNPPPAPDLDRLQALVRPVKIDGRLHAHEWLRLPSGALLKADALDHRAAHDLVGAQDIAWDVAGAEVELGLADVLPADPELLAFYRTAYFAFQVGLHRMAAAGLDGWPAEQARNLAAAARYEALAARP